MDLRPESPESLLDLIRKRRSIRSFLAERPVAKDMLQQVIEAGIWAPTGTNQQELRFHVMTEPERLEEFSHFKKIKTAPCIVLIFIDFEGYYGDYSPTLKYKRHKRPLPYIDTGLCMMNMMLMAEALGLNSVPLNITPNLYYRDRKNRGLIRRLIQAACVTTGQSAFGVHFFSRFCRDLGIDTRRYIPAGAVALGYGAKQVDIARAIHGKRPIMRKDLDFYVLEGN